MKKPRPGQRERDRLRVLRHHRRGLRVRAPRSDDVTIATVNQKVTAQNFLQNMFAIGGMLQQHHRQVKQAKTVQRVQRRQARGT